MDGNVGETERARQPGAALVYAYNAFGFWLRGGRVGRRRGLVGGWQPNPTRPNGDHRPWGSDPYMPDSGLNVESNIETPSEILVEGTPVTTWLTTSYINRGARIRTGDLLLPKLLLRPPIFTKIA